MTEIIINSVNLKAVDYGENDKILTLFSYEKGLISARIKGVKKAQAKLKFAAEPFCFGQYSLCEGKGGYTVTGCEYTELFYPLRSDMSKFSAGAAMCEYCTVFVQEGQCEGKLFSLLIKCLNSLCYGEAKAENVLLYFLINALRHNGYNVDFKTCRVCGREILDKAFADFLSGGFCCGCNPEGYRSVPLSVYKAFKFLSESSLDRLDSIKIEQGNAVYALNMLNAFIGEVSGSRLKSIKTGLL